MISVYRCFLRLSILGLSMTWLLGSSLCLWQAEVYAGEIVASKAIVKALKERKTRSLSKNLTASKEVIKNYKALRRTRGPTMQEREALYEAIKPFPQIDLLIYFNFDSDKVTSDGVAAIKELADALKDEQLKGMTFVVAGHTDAKGTAAYNLDLSRRRAEAVKNVLVERYGIGADSLTTAWYGFEKLARPEAPYAAENRRVQFVNGGD